FDGKRFTATGPRGCNMCAGVVSEHLTGRLNEIGITFPDEIVQSRIQGYKLKTMMGELSLYNKNKEGKILTVFRGNGPDYSSNLSNVSFDNFLLEYVQGIGVELIQQPVSDITLPSGIGNEVRIEYGRGNDKKNFIADGVVIACGLNTSFLEKLKNMGFGYIPPKVVNTCQMEIALPPEYIKSHFSNMIFVYSLGIPGIRFAAIVPKSEHLTVTVVGNKNMKKTDMWAFLRHPLVKKDMPDDWDIPERYCHCHPKIGLTPSRNAWTDRLVIIGDASWSRYYKNALESAFWTARFAAESIVEHGWSRAGFKKYYYKKCKEKIVRDNSYGRLLFGIDRYITSLGFMTRAHITVANKADKNRQVRSLRRIIWNILTGNVPYKDIMKAALNPLLQITLTWQILKDIAGGFRKQVEPKDGRDKKHQYLLPPRKAVIGIIGGGPAGCGCAIAARMLASRNNLDLKVLLYEKRYVRNEKKTCAGVLSPPIKKILKQLDIEIPEEMIHHVITDYVLHGEYENLHLTRGELEEEPTFSVQRNRFDDFLFEKARDNGVTIIEEELTDINILEDEVLLHSANATRRCDVVVGAFGLNEKMLTLFEERLKTYKRPNLLRSILIELPMDENVINHKFKDTIHAFLPRRMGRIEFAAITPKKDSLTINAAGSRVTEKDMELFLRSPEFINLINVTSGVPKPFYGVFPAGLGYLNRLLMNSMNDAHRL
ncbi:MAG: hypothetical protein HYV48_04195, partial [Candidatus Omnitrophica bacterium]|nr:hypothetical protein [Candidatus Omnitrophota bacterium]